MSQPAPVGPSADRNLLFGVLALQADLLDPARFAEACTAWSARKDTPLADLLVERGWLGADERAHVDFLLDRKLKKHGGDAKAGLAEVASERVRQTLDGVADPVVHQTLATLAPADGVHEKATVSYQPVGRNRYALTRLHAKGGIGQVWLARDTDLGREVALKELQGDRAADPATLARFVEEAKITGQLEHPNIVPVYELARTADAAPLYTMRFVRGRTLGAAIKDYHEKRRAKAAGRLDLRELLSQFVSVCNAVAYAHSRGVLHRDLKPGNVVLGNFGEVIVLDWGLAKLKAAAEAPASLLPVSVAKESSRDATVQGQVLGTPSYMPPEQAEGRLDLVDERSDVYALGAVLYEVLTGEAPFGGTDTMTILAQVVADAPVPPRKHVAAVPSALEAVCLKALAKQPADRYASAGDLGQEVRRWLADEPVTAYAEPRAARAARWARRHRVLVAGGVAALLVATVGLAATAAVVGGKNAELAGKNAALAASNEREREAAERAQRTVEDMTSEEALQFLTTQRELRPEQRRFLERALAYYREATREQAAGVEGRARQAAAFWNMGKLQEHLGLLPEAEAAYRAAVDEYARLVDEDPRVPEHRQGLARSRRELGSLLDHLGKHPEALAIFRVTVADFAGLVTEYPSVAQYRYDLARGRSGLALALTHVGNLAESNTEHRAAIKEFERLTAEYPRTPEYRLQLAQSQMSLGSLLASSEGEAAYRAALKEQERLTADYPQVPEYRLGLAKIRGNLAISLYQAGKFPAAEVEFRASIEQFERLAADYPLVPQYRMGRALNHNNYGQLLGDTGKCAEAAAETRAAIKDYARLVAEEPLVPKYRFLLAEGRNNLGELLATIGMRSEAETEIRAAITENERLVAGYPQVPQYAVDLGASYYVFANFVRDGGQLTQAFEWYAKAIATLESARDKVVSEKDVRRDLRKCRLGRAIARAQSGMYQEAIAEVESLLKADPADPAPPGGDFYYDASRAYARCAGKVQDAALAERYASRAVALLRQARESGYFAFPAHLQPLQTDKDFEFLSRRADFKKLLADLEANMPKQK